MDLHTLRLRQQGQGHQGGDALVSAADGPRGRGWPQADATSLVSMMGRQAEPFRVGGKMRMGVQEGATAGPRQPLEPRLPVLFPAQPCTASGSPLRPSQASSTPAGGSRPRSSPGALPCWPASRAGKVLPKRKQTHRTTEISVFGSKRKTDSCLIAKSFEHRL